MDTPSPQESFSPIQQARSDALRAAQEKDRKMKLRQSLEKDTSEIDTVTKKNSFTLGSAISRALRDRKKVSEGDLSAFILPSAFALSKDGLLDPVSNVIPTIGIIIVFVPSASISIYLFIFLFGKGTFKWKIIRSLLLLLDIFAPIVNLIPISTFCVFITYRQEKKKHQDQEKLQIE